MLWVYSHYKYLTLTVRGSTLDVRRLKIDPRAVRVNHLGFSESQIEIYLTSSANLSGTQPLIISRYQDCACNDQKQLYKELCDKYMYS